MRAPNRFNDAPAGEVMKRQARKAAADQERFDFKQGTLPRAGMSPSRKVKTRTGRKSY